MKHSFITIVFAAWFSLLLIGCDNNPKTLFELLPSNKTGITFNNTISETDSFNILTYDYIYNGGGVGIGDFNNDGKQDVFFTGNQVPNQLYLNEGEMKFKDISATANVNIKGRWSSGVAVVDINNDGWMDLYVCATTNPNPEERKNMLFVNQGLDASGTPTFREMASEYKIDYNGHSIMAAFFDYDRDGDLDLYILVNEKTHNMPTAWRPKITDGSASNNDKLYRNEGNNTFKDVTMEAGITYEGFGLGLAICDFNNDGWPDIYVSNDYMSTDILYINHHDGTFSNETATSMGHQSQFSMGSDAADVNNDGLSDLITVDMLPETNERKKTTIGNKSYSTVINNEKFGYEYQYVRNMLQLNNGLDKGIKFSEVGQLSGIYQTEWSWSPLFVDFDNDGFKDLVITNGFPKDITDKDFANYRGGIMNLASPAYLIDSIPVIKIPNYAFRNNGDLTFTDVSAKWGLNLPSFSNGAAFVDLDNDGDLDYIVNNINSESLVYENNLYSGKDKKDAPSYLRVKLKGPKDNKNGLGAKITLFYDHGKMQYHDHSVYRGYLSSVEDIVHFGLGKQTVADSLVVTWPDGKSQTSKDLKANQVITADYANAAAHTANALPTKMPAFSAAAKATRIEFKQAQTDVIDFNIQRTIPHKFSQYGPALAAGDINGDNLEDFFVAGPEGVRGTFYLQQKNGTFNRADDRFKGPKGKSGADAGVLLFDADNDHDLDLYIVGGGFEWEKNSINYQDKLFMNDGRGYFTYDSAALPVLTSSGSCVRAADFDADGDLDLFVGGRVIPSQYPFAPDSYLLKNEKGKFTDVTATVAPDLKNIGMITDAVWSDIDGDKKVDLVVIGELMPVVFLKNNGTVLSVLKTSLDDNKGWWSGITAGDFDNDGDIDYIAGNLGDNNFYHASKTTPVKVIAKDLDNNGSIDAITGCYFRMKDGSMQLCPAHFWDELNMQSPRFRRQFSRYKKFSTTTMAQLLSVKDMEGALVLEGNYPSSSYIENTGNGTFKMTPLPIEVQVAPVFGMVPFDFDHDGNLDVLIVGNDMGNEVFAGRYDAFTGLVLKGNGHGGFDCVKAAETGFYVPGDAKALMRISGKDGQDIFIASQNKDSLKVFSNVPYQGDLIKLEAEDAFADLTLPSGKKQHVEFYYGLGFISQSGRHWKVPAGATSISVSDFRGNSRKVEKSVQ